jgi:HKD family nuclease
MDWFLQTPDGASPKLLVNIASECESASKGAAPFAFASAMGVKLLTAEPEFQKFLKASEFVAVIGLDGITDTKAVEELRKVRDRYPNFKPKLFLHGTAGSCFHPKTMWLKTAKGGVIITGSGNLTSGGLKANWESMAVEQLNPAEMNAAEAVWVAWLKAHEKQLLDLDDPAALEKAKANKIQHAKIKKALKLPEEENGAAEGAVDAT